MMKLIISLLLITSVNFAQNQSKVPQQPNPIEEALKKSDPALQDTDEMSLVKDRQSACPSCDHSALLASGNYGCEVLKIQDLCPKSSGGEDTEAQKGTN
ncbi:MAG: hypothetical protein MK008_09420 [Bdellovibrionales bacterium]|nr:hypothetical protein [Bdellovibrionales bacterium]